MRTAVAALVLALAACGGKGSGSSGGTTGGTDAGFAPFTFPGYDASYSAGPFTVQPGTQIVMCTFLKATNTQDVDVSDFAMQQSIGGHHLIVYTVDHSIDLPPTPCSQGGQPSWVEVMGTQNPTEQISLPSGVGFHLKAGQQLVMETHYINATDHVLSAVQSGFAVKYAPAGTVTQQAHAYFFGTQNINIAPGATFTNSATCSPPNSLTFYSVQGHEHAYGTGVTVMLQHAADGGSVTDGGFLYETQQWDSPPITIFADGGGLELGPSDQIQVTCNWDNAGTVGLSYPQEMCYAVGFYWPGPGSLFCISGGGTDQCGCGYEGTIDTGPGGSTVQVQVSLETGLTGTLGDPPTSGHPIYCALYTAADWPAGNTSPNPNAQPYYQADVEGVALGPTTTATVTFTDVTPGEYSAFCFEDTISGGLIPGTGDPITFPLGDVTAVQGQTATTAVVLDYPFP
jgi:hypothetical protein